MCADSVWLQGTGGGIAAEILTFLEIGTGLTGSQGATAHQSKGRIFSDWKGKKGPEGLAPELKSSLTEDYLPLE